VKPNIVYIHSHDTGRFIQPYGHPVPTPHLQKLAEQGVLFRQCFNGGPTCSPSRACLLTGMSAHRNGMLGLAHRGFGLYDPRQHLAHTLKDAGYATALCGTQHVTHDIHSTYKTFGYDRYLGNAPESHTRAAEFLDNAPQQPFFLAVGFGETHRRFPEPSDQHNPDYCLPPPPLPDTPETRADMAAFKTSASILDRKMGEVFDAIDRNGLSNNTLVICTTDHGIAFPGMKCNLTDWGIGVMLIVRGPSQGFPAGTVCDSMVSHVDIFPTVCEAAGIAAPDRLEGKSVLPMARGETTEIRDAIFSEVNYHAAYEPMRCVRTKRWKYIRRYEPRARPVRPNCDDSPSKTVWLENGWNDRAPDDEQLYDIIFDPCESHNLVATPAAAGALAEMRARLERWMHETNDPLLEGVIPTPAKIVLTPADALSPRERVEVRKVEDE